MTRIEDEIAKLLREYQARMGKLLTLGTAESATGGRIADKITNIPGSSDYYKGSIVAYSNEVKINLLGVKNTTIKNYGAVSPQTAIEMAESGRKLLDVDICISVTGIAGPSGATPKKPAGLFYLGLSATNASLNREHRFPGDREGNKRDATDEALNILREYLLQCLGKIE